MNVADIRKRLDRLAGYGMLDSSDHPSPAASRPEPGHPRGFTQFFTSTGATWRRRVEFARDHPHGDRELGDLLPYDPRGLPVLIPNEEPPRAWDDLVFLDLETTGLSTGAGTYAFLVGLCFFRGDTVVLEQYFMPDPAEEPALLAAVADRLEEFSHLATFNGKRFDLPLLSHRYLMHRLPHLDGFSGHHDLLHPARALWKDTLPSCALSSLEVNRLGVIREGDVPGAEVPARYFLYLEDGDFSHLEQVIEHNARDLLSCITLLAVMLRRSEDAGACAHPAENLALARRAERAGDDERARSHFERALELAQACRGAHFERVARTASLWYKRRQMWEEALEIWEGMIERGEDSRWGELAAPLPYIELAKYYEHRAGRCDRALEYTERAIVLVRRQIQTGLGSPGSLDELQHRRRRLQRRLRADGKNVTGT